jgi:hypothetical protein
MDEFVLAASNGREETRPRLRADIIAVLCAMSS